MSNQKNIKNQNIAIAVPAFNEASSIRPIIEKLLQYSSHIIVVNDASTDETVNQISDLPITILHNIENLGKGASLLKAFKQASKQGATAVITIDADGQHNPDDIPRFLSIAGKSPSALIIGSRLKNRENAPKARLRANNIADFFISWAAGEKILDTQSGYRLYPIKTLQSNIKKEIKRKKFAFESELLIDSVRQGSDIVSLPILSYYPQDGRASHYRPIHDTCEIILTVGWKIISRGFCPRGFFKALFKKATLAEN